MNGKRFDEKKRFIYVHALISIFYLTHIISADMMYQEGFSSGATPYGQLGAGSSLSGMNTFGQGGVNGSAALGGAPGVPMIAGAEGYKWQKEVSFSDGLNDVVGNEINWQERKALKQKTNDYYNNILKLIDDSKEVFDKFRSKIEPISDLKSNLQKEIDEKAVLFENNIRNEDQLFLFFGSLIKDWEAIKNSHLYKLNKEFREKVDELSFSINNIAKMKNHFYSSKNDFYNFINIVVNSLNELYLLQEKMTFYEELAWEKYDQLDELITETEANNNYYFVINCFDNIVLIGNYLRTDYLAFLNNAIYELSNANDSIVVLFNTVGESIREIQKNIIAFDMDLKAYDIAEKEKEIAEEQKKIQGERAKERQLEEKKKKELEALNQRTFFAKLIDQIKVYYGDSKKYIGSIFEKATALVLNNDLIKRIQGVLGGGDGVKSFVKAKELNKEIAPSQKKEVSPEVSKAVSEIEAPKDAVISTEAYTVNSVIANQKVPSLSPDQLVKAQIESEPNDGEEGFNVFNTERAYIPLTEKKKSGGSSYPIKVQPMVATGDSQYNIQDNVMFGVDDTVTLMIPEEKESSATRAPRNSFKYAPLDVSEKRSGLGENENLVPDLSSHQAASSVRVAGLNLGISGEQVERLSFAEDISNGNRQARRRNERERRTRNQRRKKKEAQPPINTTPYEPVSLTTT